MVAKWARCYKCGDKAVNVIRTPDNQPHYVCAKPECAKDGQLTR